jgi:SAM-dependent methyltransferase
MLRVLPMTLEEFLREQLPPQPARLLEVGCGQHGELATTLSIAGWDVLAIDPMAPPGPIFRRLRLEELEPDEGPFDAVVAVRSLHHIRELEHALETIDGLLAPGGVFAVEEFAWDLADEPTLQWLGEQRRSLGRDTPATVEQLAEEWQAEHLGLHGYVTMLGALREHFAERVFAPVPTLYHELDGGQARVVEQALIDAGAIRALGFRWSGTGGA